MSKIVRLRTDIVEFSEESSLGFREFAEIASLPPGAVALRTSNTILEPTEEEQQFYFCIYYDSGAEKTLVQRIGVCNNTVDMRILTRETSLWGKLLFETGENMYLGFFNCSGNELPFSGGRFALSVSYAIDEI